MLVRMKQVWKVEEEVEGEEEEEEVEGEEEAANKEEVVFPRDEPSTCADRTGPEAAVTSRPAEAAFTRLL